MGGKSQLAVRGDTMKRRLPFALLTLVLAACAQPPDSGGTLPPEPVGNYDSVDGAWTTPPHLSAQSLTADVNTLYYETALVATNAWGPIEVDRSNGERGIGDGRTLTLNGTKYPKGYGVHAPSELKYSLAGSDNARCVRFRSQIGVDDEVGSRGSVVFQVWGDGEKLYDSGVMTGASATKSVSVDLRGKKTIRMVVTDAGNGKTADHADWIAPTITCVPDITGSVSRGTGIYQDTHRNVPVTFTNSSGKFAGDLSFRLTSDVSVNDYKGTRFRLDTWGTKIVGAGTFQRNLSVYMPPLAFLELGEEEPELPYPDTLVVFYRGEEVTRVPLRVYPIRQSTSPLFPSTTIEVRLGEPTIVIVPVEADPGGETTGPAFSIYPDSDSPAWLDVQEIGGGEVPKEGGAIQVKFTATRAPEPNEPRERYARLRIYDYRLAGGNFTSLSNVNVRFVP